MMRKANRAITDFDEIKALIDSCDTIRLGFVDGDEAYIVPLSFGFEAENGEFTFYVHGAKVGRRHTLAAKSSRVCVEADHEDNRRLGVNEHALKACFGHKRRGPVLL